MGVEDTNTFNKIKQEFLKEIILKYTDFSKPFYMNANASDIALGVVLYQVSENIDHIELAFASRSLQNFEWRYTIIEKELISVIFGHKKFRNYILGNETIIWSGDKAWII